MSWAPRASGRGSQGQGVAFLGGPERGSQNRTGAVAKQKLRRPPGYRNSPEAVPRPRAGQRITTRRDALRAKGKRQPEPAPPSHSRSGGACRGITGPGDDLPAARVFESTAIFVGSETLSTAIEICRENNRELASHPDEAGGSASTLNLSVYRLATMCESADTARLGCAFPRHHIGQELERGPEANFQKNWFHRKLP